MEAAIDDIASMTPAEMGEVILGAAHNLGICSGWDDCAEWLRGLSGQRYADGDDDGARLLRELAAKAKAKNAELRTFYDDILRPRSQAAFRALEALEVVARVEAGK